MNLFEQASSRARAWTGGQILSKAFVTRLVCLGHDIDTASWNVVDGVIVLHCNFDSVLSISTVGYVVSVVQLVGLVESRIAWVWSNATVQELILGDHLIVSVKGQELETSHFGEEARFEKTNRDVLSHTLGHAPLEDVITHIWLWITS